MAGFDANGRRYPGRSRRGCGSSTRAVQTALTDLLGALSRVSADDQRFLGEFRKIGFVGRTYHRSVELTGRLERQIVTAQRILAQRPKKTQATW
jgi:hypothetical protein